MHSFTDTTGRHWTVAITVDTVRRVRALTGVNLVDAADASLFERLANDPVLLCDVIYAACKPEADARGVSDEAFGQAMAGDAIEQATQALLEDLVDFFPSQRRRVLTKALDKLRAVEARALALAEERLNSPELERQIEEAIARCGAASTSSPAPSASIPDH